MKRLSHTGSYNRSRRLTTEQLERRDLLSADAFRAFDGLDNNLEHPEWGSAGTQLQRLTTVEYADGISEPAGGADGSGRSNPRDVSNQVFAQNGSIANDRDLTSFVFQWGQFLDHDMGLTEDARPSEPFSIAVPADDADLDPNFPIPVLRSRFDPTTGTGLEDPRQQINQITAYVDASNVYGSDLTKANGLRANYGGLLLTGDGVTNVGGEGNLLPWNYEFEGEFLENATPPPFTPDELFIAGDIRSNEQPGLTSLHTLFVREHNYQARQLAEALLPGEDLDQITGEDDEQIYQMARRIVAAEIQSITYNEFLPALFGPDQLDSYSSYDRHANAGIANIFAHGIYRVGHTMLPDELLRLDNEGNSLPEGPIALGDAFFDPALITDFGIEPYLKGLSVQTIQEIDAKVVDGVRNLLFDPPAQLDLVATNLQRGRDHGLPDYNQALVDFGLEPITSFDQISSDPSVADAMQLAYAGDVNNIDVWAAAVAADHVAGGSVGELIHHVLVDQFTRLRDGDRYYYENTFRGSHLDQIQNTRLSEIVERNTSLTGLQGDLFRDNSVLVYRAEEGRRAAIITLQVDDGMVQVVDHRDRVLAEKPVSDTSRVVLYGTSRSDRVSLAPSASAQLNVDVELHGGGGNDRLRVDATAGNDDLEIGQTRIRINGLQLFQGSFEYIDVRGGAGDDVMLAVGVQTGTRILSGGRGDDLMQASESGQVLRGGAGSDQLFGGSGRDILVGGRGSDELSGGAGDDILIGNSVSFSNARQTWSNAVELWNSDAPYDAHVGMLRGNVFRETGASRTILEDNAVDTLLGGEGQDWFLARSELDEILDAESGESVK